METKYKVIRQFEGNLVSFIVYNSTKYMVKYLPNKWVEAPIGGLLVFDTLKNAEMFAHGYGDIWECEVEIPIPLPPQNASNVTENVIPLIWQNNFPDLWATDWPIGTEAYKKVKLIKLLIPQTKY